jgi:diguanylate cyclase
MHSQDVGGAQTIAQAAMGYMSDLEIPATPENFAVWYAYCAGSNPELTKAIDILLSNRSAFTPERNAEIHERFFGLSAHEQAVQSTGHKLENAMGRVLALIGQAGADTSAYGRRMADLSGELSGGHSLDEVQATVKQIVAETRGILIKNQELEHRLARSTREIKTLRRDLESVRRDALTDPLTGIANRKLFDQRLREACAGALETGGETCLVLLDIDHFKAFNDRYGHRVGDEVLKLVAKQMRDQVKGRDTPARYGGEEFALILPETSLVNAAKLADRIREALSGHTLTSRRSAMRYGRITLSAGVAAYRYGEPLEQLLQRADRALYRAKDQGRNRVAKETDLPEEDGAGDTLVLKRPAG